MAASRRFRQRQQGVLLLEVLIAILIFALGVLGLVGLQANAVQQSSQSKYRADATLLANDLIGQMWITNRTYATLQAGFTSDAGGGPQYNAWKARVQAMLPGADVNPPVVTVVQIAPLNAIVGGNVTTTPPPGATPSSRVTIVMRWKAPSEKASDPVHSFTLVNEIK